MSKDYILGLRTIGFFNGFKSYDNILCILILYNMHVTDL